MTAYEVVNAVVRIAAAALFAYAGAEKLAAPSAFRATLTALRIPWTVPVSTGVPLVELAAAFALLNIPRSLLTAALVVGLGAAFAFAGALAMARGTRVKCACFGQVDAGLLGPRQIVLLPVWAGVGALAFWTPDRSPTGPGVTVAVVLALAGFVALKVAALTRKNREYMRAMVPK